MTHTTIVRCAVVIAMLALWLAGMAVIIGGLVWTAEKLEVSPEMRAYLEKLP